MSRCQVPEQLGPPIRSDIVDVYVFRRGAAGLEFLQMRRCKGRLAGTWHPVMGHIEPGETAVQTALRELQEETGYAAGTGLLAFWHLEKINLYYLAAYESIVASPCFAAEVQPGVEPTLDDSHDAWRWVPRDAADRSFLWTGQRAAIEHLVRDILPADAPASAHLRIDLRPKQPAGA